MKRYIDAESKHQRQIRLPQLSQQLPAGFGRKRAAEEEAQPKDTTQSQGQASPAKAAASQSCDGSSCEPEDPSESTGQSHAQG